MRWIALVAGLMLCITGGLFLIRRHDDAALFWMTTRITNDQPGYYGYYLISPDSSHIRRIGSGTSSSNGEWYLGWSPDARYLYYQKISFRNREPEGIFRYDVQKKQSDLVLERPLNPQLVHFYPSPDKQWAMVVIAHNSEFELFTLEMGSSSLKAIYEGTFEADFGPMLMHWADDDWFYFQDRDRQGYHINTVGDIKADIETVYQVTSPNDDAVLELTIDGWTLTQQDGSSHVVFPRHYNIVKWFESDWVIMTEWLGDDDLPIEVRYHRARPDGSEFQTLYVGTLASNLFWLNDPDVVFVEQYDAPSQERNLLEINLTSGQTRELISQYGRMLSPTAQYRLSTPPTMIMAGERLIWQKRYDNRLGLFALDIHEGTSQRLLEMPYFYDDYEVWVSPRSDHIYVTYYSMRPNTQQNFHIVGIDLATGESDSITGEHHELLAISPPFGNEFHGWHILIAGVILLGTAMSQIFSRS